MFTIQLIESDEQRRSLYTAKLAGNGISIVDGPEAAGANLVLASVTDPDIAKRVQEVVDLRNRFPNSTLAIVTQYLSVAFIYQVSNLADAVFSTPDTEKDDASWTDFAKRLQRVTRD